MIFTHHQTVLVVPVVRLVVSPVKPVDSGVPVGPVPLTIVVVFTVTALKRGGNRFQNYLLKTYCCFSSQPELVELSWLSVGKQFGFQPVVDS